MNKKRNSSFVSRRLCLGILLILLICGCTLTSARFHIGHRESRKLIKYALAASLFHTPGFGILPIPLPVPLPFSVESVKPPVILTSPFVPFFHGGHGIGFGGGGGGFGGGFYGR